MLIRKSLVLLSVVLALNLTAADDNGTPEAKQKDAVGKLSDWWNEYIEKVKASSPTPVWIKGSSNTPPKKVPLWWLDVEVPSSTRRRLKHSKFTMEWPLLGHRKPTTLGQGTTSQKRGESCPHCPCQTTAQHCPHCGCQSTTCHDQQTESTPDTTDNSDGNNHKDGSDGEDHHSDMETTTDSGSETTKPFKRCTCKRRPNCCLPCQNFRACTCSKKAAGRSGRSAPIIEVVKSDASCQALATLCLILPLVTRLVTILSIGSLI